MRAIRGMFYPGEIRNSFFENGDRGKSKSGGRKHPSNGSHRSSPLGRVRVPDQERVVLTILYVPQRMPLEQQLRLLRVPPRLCRERHQRGLQMFWTLWRLTA